MAAGEVAQRQSALPFKPSISKWRIAARSHGPHSDPAEQLTDESLDEVDCGGVVSMHALIESAVMGIDALRHP